MCYMNVDSLLKAQEFVNFNNILLDIDDSLELPERSQYFADVNLWNVYCLHYNILKDAYKLMKINQKFNLKIDVSLN